MIKYQLQLVGGPIGVENFKQVDAIEDALTQVAKVAINEDYPDNALCAIVLSHIEHPRIIEKVQLGPLGVLRHGVFVQWLSTVIKETKALEIILMHEIAKNA